MGLYDTGYPVLPYQSVNAGVIPQDVYGIAINWFLPRAPLIGRATQLPVGSLSFMVTSDNYRPRSQALTADINSSATTLSVTDSSYYVVGDILEIEDEQVIVSAKPSSTTLTIARAYAGTTAAGHLTGVYAYLATEAGTGGDVDREGLSRIPVPVTQYCQTVHHSYGMSGSLESATNYTSGFASPLDRDRMMCMQNCVDDFESACYYGKGQALSASQSYQTMKGLRALVQTNNITNPANKTAYKPSDFIRDVIEPCWSRGGNPNFALVSTDFLNGLAVWGIGAMTVQTGETLFGAPITKIAAPFLGTVNLIPAPLLRSGTAIGLNSNEVRLRIKRALHDKPRGSRGDATEGDMIMEGAIELDNESHHSFVTGVTGFAAA